MTRPALVAPLVLLSALSASSAWLFAGCGGDESLPPLPDMPSYVLTADEGRPAQVYAPSDYDPSVQYPLVILLHGYSAGGGAQNLYFGVSRHVTTEQFILVVPNGTRDMTGTSFWNSDPIRSGETVDDVAYLRRLIEEAKANFRVDPRRVYLFGHSNGGFMSYRMACEASDVITAIASLNGMPPEDPSECDAELPVSVVQIHGTADEDVLYDGEPSSDGSGYLGAEEAVERFAAAAGCDVDAAEVGTPLDLDDSLAGAETTVLDYEVGCDRNLGASLWTIEGGGHLPVRSDTFVPSVVQWLKGHSR